MANNYIDEEKFNAIEIGDMLKVRYIRGMAIVEELPVNGSVIVKFTGGPWHDRTLSLIRQQIAKINQ